MPSSQPPPDPPRRQHQRRDLRMSAEVRTSRTVFTATTRDLSEGGAGLNCRSAARRRRRGDARSVPGARRRRGRHAAAVGEGARGVGAQRGPTPRRRRSLRGHHRRADGPGCARCCAELGSPSDPADAPRRLSAAARIRSATRAPSSAALTMPPAYPAPSPHGIEARQRRRLPASPRSRSEADRRAGARLGGDQHGVGDRKPGSRAPMRAQARRAAPRRRTAGSTVREVGGRERRGGSWTRPTDAAGAAVEEIRQPLRGRAEAAAAGAERGLLDPPLQLDARQRPGRRGAEVGGLDGDDQARVRERRVAPRQAHAVDDDAVGLGRGRHDPAARAHAELKTPRSPPAAVSS